MKCDKPQNTHHKLLQHNLKTLHQQRVVYFVQETGFEPVKSYCSSFYMFSL